jgi:large subunit ribosomal protein L15
MSSIDQVNRGITKYRKRKRIGRGTGSGHGKTSGRGHKGQGSRSGYSMPELFEGGQMPLVRRIPKRGFNNKAFADKVVIINLCDLEAFYNDGAEVTPDDLKKRRLIVNTFDQLKVLGNGALTKKLNVVAHAFSESAKSKIESLGGTVNVLTVRKPVVKNKMGSRKAAAVANSGIKSLGGSKTSKTVTKPVSKPKPKDKKVK